MPHTIERVVAEAVTNNFEKIEEPKEVLAQDFPIEERIPIELSAFVREAAYKKGSEITKDLGGILRLRIKKGFFKTSKVDVREDGSSEVVLHSDAVPIGFRGDIVAFRSLYTYNKKYSNLLTVTLERLSRVRHTGRGKIPVTLTLNLTPDETKSLCGNTPPESFKIANSFETLLDSGFKAINPYFSPMFIKDRDPAQKANIIIRAPSGQFLFLPETDYRGVIEDQLRRSFDPETSEFTAPETEEGIKIPAEIVYWNLGQGILLYMSSDGKMRNFPIEGSTVISKKVLVPLMESSFNSLVLRFGQEVTPMIRSILTVKLSPEDTGKFWGEIRVYEGRSDNPEATMEVLNRSFGGTGKTILTSVIKSLKSDTVEPAYAPAMRHPLRKYSLIALLTMMRDNFGKMEALRKEAATRVERINESTAKELPELPDNLDPDLQLWPHQAEALARLEVADDTAILDIATGGGKTLILICNILRLLLTGKIKKPIIIVPTNLVPQWFDEIQDFGGGKINCIIIDTETMRKWGLDSLAKLAKGAPKNTIFLTTYSWLTTDYEVTKVGTRPIHDFLTVKFIKSLGFDYVSWDESQYCKKMKALRSKACQQLSSNIPYKRLATGTLIPNTPADVPGQIALLDPGIFGTDKEFIDRYAESVSRGGRVRKWREDAYDEIKENLKSVGAITYTRKDWFHLLPKFSETYHIVDLTSAQKKVYDSIVQATLDEILADPKLAALWEEFRDDPDGTAEDSLFRPLLTKLHRIEMFISNPERDEMSDILLSGKDLISPKVTKVEEILVKHFSKTPKQKILILNQHVEIAKYFLDKSKFKKYMIFYRGGMRDALHSFKTDPNVKILVGVDFSLMHGHNLQVASRMIRLDVHWTPGELDQILARIYRPTKEMDVREKVHIDWVLGNNTVDVLKFRRLIRKLAINSKVAGIIKKTDIPDRPVMSVSETSLLYGGNWADAEADEVKDYTRYRELEGEQWEEIRKKGYVKNYDPKIKGSLKGEKIDTPWPRGGTVPCDECLTFDEALSELAKGDISELRGYRAVTEFGKGYILNVRRVKTGHTIRIQMDDRRRVSFRDSLVGVRRERIELEKLKRKKPKKEKEYDTSKPGSVVISVGKKEFILAPKGELYRLDRHGKIKKLSYIFKKGEWLTPKGRRAKFISPKISTQLKTALKGIGYEPPPEPEIEVVPVSVNLRAVNVGGLLGMMVVYPYEDFGAVKKALTGTRMRDFPYYFVKVTASNARRIKRFIETGKIKPKNAKSFLTILDKFRQARFKMKKMDPEFVKLMIKTMRRYMRQEEFYMYPVLVEDRMQIWINNVRPQVVRKYLPKLRQLGFEEKNSFFRLLQSKGQIMSLASSIVKGLKKSKIGVDNIERFRKDLERIKKTARR